MNYAICLCDLLYGYTVYVYVNHAWTCISVPGPMICICVFQCIYLDNIFLFISVHGPGISQHPRSCHAHARIGWGQYNPVSSGMRKPHEQMYRWLGAAIRQAPIPWAQSSAIRCAEKVWLPTPQRGRGKDMISRLDNVNISWHDIIISWHYSNFISWHDSNIFFGPERILQHYCLTTTILLSQCYHILTQEY